MTAGRPDYFYSVAAVDSNGDIGELSKNVRVTVPGTPTPTLSLTQTPTPTTTPGQTPTPTPTSNVTGKLLAPTLNAPSTATNAVDLSWTEVFGAVRYVLFEWDEVNLWRQIGGDNLTGTSYSQKNVTAGTTYVYTVAAVDVNNLWGHLSAQKRVILSGAWGILPAPPLTATSTVATTVELRWTEVTHAVKYDLWTWWDSTIGWQRINDSLKGASYIHRGLTPGTTYYYAIRAVDANGAAGPLTESPFPEATVIDSSVIQDAAEEKAALVALYNATNGPNWTHSDNWTTDEPLSTWSGVFTDENGHVTSLDLSNHRLSGAIPDLSALTYLTSLLLSANQLSGPLPDLSALTNLTRLAIVSAQLTGPIPNLSALTNLRELYLSGNQLTGPIPDLSALTNLTELYLSFNQLTGPIPDLSALTSLTDLYLNNNQLSGRVPDLSALTKLIDLYLLSNLLSGPFPDLSALTYLTNLNLTGNQLCRPAGVDLSGSHAYVTDHLNSLNLPICSDAPATATPTSTATTSTLATATPTATATTSTLATATPTSTATTSTLSTATPTATATTSTLATATPTATASSAPPAPAAERAALAALYNATDGDNWTRNTNWLSAAPVGTWHGVFTNEFGRVKSMSLSSNGLSGSLPDLSALTNLRSLRLDNNDLSGPLPDLSKLTQLTVIYLPGNELSGPIPDLSALTNLYYLYLFSNQLSGPFPDLSRLTSLSRLYLSGNELTGPLPDLSQLTNLRRLGLGSNKFSGQIPDPGALTNLTHLSLYGNEFGGSIPDLSALTRLTDLSLSNNKLDGHISDLSTLTNLKNLYLADNQLDGQIPDMSALTSLENLTLKGNQLTGQAPDLSALTRLKYLDLSSNLLSGQIPNLGALTNLKRLTLNSNQFSGHIPEMGALTLLTTLILSSNQLSGQIPDLSTLSELVTLILYDNQLTGPILDLNHLSKLTSLNLRNNQLGGPFPNLSALTNLTGLDLRGNSLCLPSGSDLAGSNSVVTTHLNSLNLAACTEAELSSFPAAPQNVAATVGNGQVTLTWDAVADAASYELRAWDSFDRTWGAFGGVLTDTTTYTHTVQTDGRNYYYQVHARDANDVRGAWSEQLYVAVVPTQFPPPPASLGLEMYYQKHMVVGGVTVVAPSLVSEEQMIRSRAIITGILANRPDLLATLASYNTRIYIQDRFKGIAQRGLAYTPVTDPYCNTFIHEFAHLVDHALEEQADAAAFDERHRAVYQAAINAGLWSSYYASTNAEEYWAETVKYWLWESTLLDRDPEIVKLIEDTLGEVTIPAACKP